MDTNRGKKAENIVRYLPGSTVAPFGTAENGLPIFGL
jgi:hypothetical protein